jgi:transposase
MTLYANDRFTIPEETARVAKATFPKGNVYMTLRDELTLWYKDSAYAHLFPSHQGRPAESLDAESDHGHAVCRGTE